MADIRSLSTANKIHHVLDIFSHKSSPPMSPLYVSTFYPMCAKASRGYVIGLIIMCIANLPSDVLPEIMSVSDEDSGNLV